MKGKASAALAALALATVSGSLSSLSSDGLDHAHDNSPACPRCLTNRTWISGETWRCRDCGTRFTVPEPEEKTKP